MPLFDHIPSDLFSLLSSPNRILYADALEVLYETYKDNQLKISESALYSALRGKLERQLAEASFEEEDIDEEELQDISGRARFLIRKLYSKGWIDKERGEDDNGFTEYITVPGYSSRLLELFSQLSDDRPLRGYSYVFSTYSSLKVAQESGNVYDKMAAVYSAYDNSQDLINLLKMVYNNVKSYFRQMRKMTDMNQVLSSHFDDFGLKVVDTYIRPLKIRDSVPKYRVPIQTILDGWLADEAMLTAMANEAYTDKRGESLAACRYDLARKMFQIRDAYDHIQHDYLDEIDKQVRRYTRSTTQKIENLANRDQNVRGNLNLLLSALSRNRRSSDLVDKIQPVFQLYEQSYLSERSLWCRKRPVKRQKTAPVIIDDIIVDEDVRQRALALLNTEYNRASVASFLDSRIGDSGVCYSKDWHLNDDKAYIMCLLSVLHCREDSSDYAVEVLEGSFSENDYTIPQLKFTRKESTR